LTLGKDFAECPIEYTRQRRLYRDLRRRVSFAECKKSFTVPCRVSRGDPVVLDASRGRHIDVPCTVGG